MEVHLSARIIRIFNMILNFLNLEANLVGEHSREGALSAAHRMKT